MHRYQSGAVYRKRRIYPQYTASWLIRLAVEAMHHPTVLEHIRPLVRQLYTVNEDPIASRYSEFSAILNYLTARVRYTFDPLFVELMYHPVEMLKRVEQYGTWVEDCESSACLTLTFLLCLGHMARLTIVSFMPYFPYEHIFAEGYIPQIGWVVVDPSMGFMGRVSNMVRDIHHALHFQP